jgi:hypothetical protein
LFSPVLFSSARDHTEKWASFDRLTGQGTHLPNVSETQVQPLANVPGSMISAKISEGKRATESGEALDLSLKLDLRHQN